MRKILLGLVFIGVVGTFLYQRARQVVAESANIELITPPTKQAKPKKSESKQEKRLEKGSDHDQHKTFKDSLQREIAESKDSMVLIKKNGIYQVNWKILSQVDFNEVFNEEMDAYIPYPDFHQQVESLDGQPITISGYIIPVDETGDEQILVLSAFPFSNCFFCGNAGPETVMDVQTKRKVKRMTLDEAVTFKGKLKLNSKDLYYLNYILEDAEIVPN